VARKAEGSMRDALSLLDQVFSFSHEKIDEAAVRSVLGIISTEIYDTVMNAVAEKNAQPVLSTVEDILSRGFDLHEFVLGLEDHLRTLLFSRIPSVMGNPRIDLPADSSGSIAKTASAFSEATLLRMAELVRKTERDLRYSDFPRFLVELMLFKLVHLDNTVELEKLLQTLGRPMPFSPGAAPAPAGAFSPPDKKKNDKPPAPPAPVAAAMADTLDDAPADDEAELKNPAPSGGDSSLPREKIFVIRPLTPRQIAGNARAVAFNGEGIGPQPGNLQAQWPEFLELLTRDRPTLAYHLSSAYVVSATNKAVDIRFPKAFHFQFNEVLKKKNRDEIQEKLNEFGRAPVELHITLEQAGDPPQAKNPAVQVKAPKSINNEITNEPIIKSVLDIFDGSVL
jgi:DNA polymerase-3 subunit gamma/tau